MTPEEAIEILGDFGKQVKAKADGAYQTNVGKMACDMAIEALEEAQKYREIGTVEQCREAVEKQNPKKPVWKKGRSVICKDYVDGHGEIEENKWANWVCPNCGWFVGEQYIRRRHNQQKSNYCSRCGQAIQWNEKITEIVEKGGIG